MPVYSGRCHFCNMPTDHYCQVCHCHFCERCDSHLPLARQHGPEDHQLLVFHGEDFAA